MTGQTLSIENSILSLRQLVRSLKLTPGQLFTATVIRKEGEEAIIRIANMTFKAKVPEDIPVQTKIWLAYLKCQGKQVIFKNLGREQDFTLLLQNLKIPDTPNNRLLIEAWLSMGLPLDKNQLANVAARLDSFHVALSPEEMLSVIDLWLRKLPLDDTFLQKMLLEVDAEKLDKLATDLEKMAAGKNENITKLLSLLQRIPGAREIKPDGLKEFLAVLGLDLENNLQKNIFSDSIRLILNKMLKQEGLPLHWQEKIDEFRLFLEQTAWIFGLYGVLHFFVPLKYKDKYFWVEWQKQPINSELPAHYILKLIIPTMNMGTVGVEIKYTGEWHGRVFHEDPAVLSLLAKEWTRLSFVRANSSWRFCRQNFTIEHEYGRKLSMKKIDLEV